MNDPASVPLRRPGIVIFVAILQFISSAFFLMLSVLSGLAIAFGAAWGIDQYVTDQMARYAPNPNFTYGLTLIFSAALGVFVLIALYFLVLGIGLLSGKRFAWYLQVAVSMIGLLTLPLGFMWSILALPLSGLLNVVILVFFFQPGVRAYFKV